MTNAFEGTANGADTARLLVVEDEVLIAMSLSDVLEGLDYEVCGVAASGRTAFEIAEAERPALALVDIGLAGSLDGIETARVLRERYAVPCIFMSGSGERDVLDRARDAQPCAFLQKPYSVAQLKTALDRAFGRA